MNNNQPLAFYLGKYLRYRPLFLSLIRSKEAYFFSKYLKLRRPILDVGCGDGFFANTVLAGKIVDVGLDVSESRITEAEKLDVYKKLITYDGEKIPFDSCYFATVFSNCVLEHIQNLSSMLSEIHRVLKPKGFFVATVMTNEWEKNLFGSLILGDRYKNWMRRKQVHRNLLSSQEWDSSFNRAGFTVVKKIGYLSPAACRIIDVCHYLSLPSLITYKIFGKWVLFPNLAKLFYPINYFLTVLNQKASPPDSGALFYVLVKR